MSVEPTKQVETQTLNKDFSPSVSVKTPLIDALRSYFVKEGCITVVEWSAV